MGPAPQAMDLGAKATDQVRRAEWNRQGRSGTAQSSWIKGARYSLLKRPENQTISQLAKLHEVQQTNRRLYRAFLLLHELRWLYRVPRDEAPEHLEAWLAWASRSKLKGPQQQAPPAHPPRLRILHSADALIATIYLCWHPDRPPRQMIHPQGERRTQHSLHQAGHLLTTATP